MRAIGIILAGGRGDKIRELTVDRAVPALPMAGSYRIIDFALSNMTNSGINKVAIITQYNSRSLLEHLNSSKWWDFGRKHGGMHIFTPYISQDNSFWYQGTADAIYQNIHFLKESHEPYVVVTSGDGVCRIDFNQVLKHHMEKKADITVVTQKADAIPPEELSRFGLIETDEDGRLLEFEEKPLEPKGNCVNTGIYIFKRRLLIELLETIISEGRHDLVSDILIRYRKLKNIYTYDYKDYWHGIGSVNCYHRTNMDFLKKEVRDSLLRGPKGIMTKVEDEPPAKFNSNASVHNAMCANGCIVNGTVIDSVLFRKVYIGNNTTIKNSVIMNGSFIGDNCYIENAIVESHSNISDGSYYKGAPDRIEVVNQKVPFYM